MGESAFLWCMVAFWTGWTVRHHLQKRIDRDGLRAIGEKLERAALSTLQTKRFIGKGFRVINESRLTMDGGKRFRVTIEEEPIP